MSQNEIKQLSFYDLLFPGLSVQSPLAGPSAAEKLSPEESPAKVKTSQSDLFADQWYLRRTWAQLLKNLAFSEALKVLTANQENANDQLHAAAIECSAFWQAVVESQGATEPDVWAQQWIHALEAFLQSETYQVLAPLSAAMRVPLLARLLKKLPELQQPLAVLQLLSRLELPQLVVEAFQAIPEQNRDHELYVAYGNALMKIRKFDEAVIAFALALLLDPDAVDMEVIEHDLLWHCYQDSLEEDLDDLAAKSRVPCQAVIRNLISVDKAKTIIQYLLVRGFSPNALPPQVQLLSLVLEVMATRSTNLDKKVMQLRTNLAKIDKGLLSEILATR